ncbi:hypothetical protein GQ43DRAFT_483896 [Delitschia confertaspora ATCC 74209]|uniref:NAD(P)-binding protein n=1 Tax=Delitschia confertaspora ATCC 74209 TaxID=1513339 RepID=A0A9P4JE24_9PLEO|nr:hypothetical protein GQ43DRAFT_483896 [Delitschia confertaspora ATCC 74209]
MATFDINTTDVDVLNTFGTKAKGKTWGIGAQVAISLASASPKLLILARRDGAKISPIIDQIKQANSAVQVEFLQLDLTSHESVQKSRDAVKAITKNVDFLVNNAGVMVNEGCI